jgi:hypothetical protein
MFEFLEDMDDIEKDRLYGCICEAVESDDLDMCYWDYAKKLKKALEDDFDKMYNNL